MTLLNFHLDNCYRSVSEPGLKVHLVSYGFVLFSFIIKDFVAKIKSKVDDVLVSFWLMGTACAALKFRGFESVFKLASCSSYLLAYIRKKQLLVLSRNHRLSPSIFMKLVFWNERLKDKHFSHGIAHYQSLSFSISVVSHFSLLLNKWETKNRIENRGGVVTKRVIKMNYISHFRFWEIDIYKWILTVVRV